MMEVVLNFDRKELVIKEKANVKELYKRLEKLLGKELGEWSIVSDVVYQDKTWWYYQPYRTYPWVYPYVGTGEGTSVYCLSDNMEPAREEVAEYYIPKTTDGMS